jgi:hypothetical protein
MGFGPTDDVDPGVISFDDDGDETDDAGHGFDTRSVVRGIQLVEDGTDIYDILIAGSTRTKNVDGDTLNMFVARIDADGQVGSVPWEWMYNKNFQDTGGVNRDDIATDVVYNQDLAELIVSGMTCATGDSCSDPDNNTPSSDIVIARINFATPLTVDYAHRVTADFAGHSTYGDVVYSVVLQPDSQPGNPPRIVVGGFSVTANTGSADDTRPFMSGRRFEYDNSVPPTNFGFFRSYFTTLGDAGDQARELRIQTSSTGPRRIVAAGTHFDSNGNPMFAAMRLCKEPDEVTCNNTTGPGTGGGGEGNGGPGFGQLGNYSSADGMAASSNSVRGTNQAGAGPVAQLDRWLAAVDSISSDTPLGPAINRVIRTSRDERDILDYVFAQLETDTPFA